MWNIMSRVSKTKGCQRLRTALLPDSRLYFLWLFSHLLHKAPYLCSAYYLECQLFASCRQGILQEKMLQCLVLDGHFYDPLPHWFCSVVFFLQLSSCSKPVPIYTLQQKKCATSCSLALGIPCEFTDPVVKREPKINLTGAVLHCESCYQHETGTTISITTLHHNGRKHQMSRNNQPFRHPEHNLLAEDRISTWAQNIQPGKSKALIRSQ